MFNSKKCVSKILGDKHSRNLTNNYIITDMGNAMLTDNKGKKIDIGRYGVWKVIDDTMDEVIETSNNVGYLKNKYNTQQVVKLNR